MFTLPPRPPKDYKLEDVSLSQVSAPEHTPFGLPRATQPSIGQYCAPVPADDNEPADKSQIEELNDQILEKLLFKSKAEWVDRPGENDFYVHDICKKYSVKVEPERDVRFQHKPRVFQRSYKYEFDCMEEARLKKLYSKMAQEEKEEQDMLTVKGKLEDNKLVVDSCKKYPPFWWRQAVDEEEARSFADSIVKPTQSVYQSTYLRWQPLPNIADDSKHDHCKRREAFSQEKGKGKTSRGSRSSGGGDRGGGGAVTHFIGECKPCIPPPCVPCPVMQYTYCPLPRPPTCSYDYSCKRSYCKPSASSCRYWC